MSNISCFSIPLVFASFVFLLSLTEKGGHPIALAFPIPGAHTSAIVAQNRNSYRLQHRGQRFPPQGIYTKKVVPSPRRHPLVRKGAMRAHNTHL
uniref:Secreted protein n=1 Tax=Rhipicephalus appendiculatus TaxID=34631 RepID=A0A131YGG6_RHIAP